MSGWGIARFDAQRESGLPSVLLIEAETPLMQRMAWILLEEGFETSKVAHASDAPDKVQEYQPDVIIMNNDMPDPQKQACIHELRTIVPNARIIDLHSASHAMQTEHKGADEYLHLPFDAQSLVEKVNVLLDR